VPRCERHTNLSRADTRGQATIEDVERTFVVPYLACLFAPAVITAVGVQIPQLQQHFWRTAVWILAATPLWIVGAVSDAEPRLACWAVAAAIDLTGTWLAHPLPGNVLRSRDIPFDGVHMIERLRLFLIIALGEAVLTTGTAIAAAPVRALTVVAGVAGLAVVVALWAVYFGGSESLVSSHIASTTDPVRAAHLGINGQYAILAGLVAIAVGNELVIAHLGEDGSITLSLLLFGGAGGSVLFARHRQMWDAAQSQVIAHVRTVLGELVPQGTVRRPRDRLVAVAPTVPEGDPDQRPVGGVGPRVLIRLTQGTPDLEGEPARIDEGWRAGDLPHAEVVRHQVQLEIAQHCWVDEHGRDVLVAAWTGGAHPSTLLRPSSGVTVRSAWTSVL
jgi:hypothetical protein